MSNIIFILNSIFLFLTLPKITKTRTLLLYSVFTKEKHLFAEVFVNESSTVPCRVTKKPYGIRLFSLALCRGGCENRLYEYVSYPTSRFTISFIAK